MNLLTLSSMESYIPLMLLLLLLVAIPILNWMSSPSIERYGRVDSYTHDLIRSSDAHPSEMWNRSQAYMDRIFNCPEEIPTLRNRGRCR